VVPGLKLRLYSHQIASLRWMRERECRHVLESDCLKNEQPSSSPCPCPDSDLHRAVSGGLTVLLRERPQNGSIPATARPKSVRIYQCFGSEVYAEDAELEIRSVARGGLLCDDPGLGKTITLLSLVLQTYGLSTAPKTRRPATATVASSESIEDVEAVFKPYWYVFWIEKWLLYGRLSLSSPSFHVLYSSTPAS
jgi:SNF2 family DNA or RNA helicase